MNINTFTRRIYPDRFSIIVGSTVYYESYNSDGLLISTGCGNIVRIEPSFTYADAWEVQIQDMLYDDISEVILSDAFPHDIMLPLEWGNCAQSE